MDNNTKQQEKNTKKRYQEWHPKLRAFYSMLSEVHNNSGTLPSATSNSPQPRDLPRQTPSNSGVSSPPSTPYEPINSARQRTSPASTKTELPQANEAVETPQVSQQQPPTKAQPQQAEATKPTSTPVNGGKQPSTQSPDNTDTSEPQQEQKEISLGKIVASLKEIAGDALGYLEGVSKDAGKLGDKAAREIGKKGERAIIHAGRGLQDIATPEQKESDKPGTIEDVATKIGGTVRDVSGYTGEALDFLGRLLANGLRVIQRKEIEDFPSPDTPPVPRKPQPKQKKKGEPKVIPNRRSPHLKAQRNKRNKRSTGGNFATTTL